MNSATARLIDKIGRDLEFTHFEKVGENDYGEVYDETSETITGRINRSGTLVQQRNEHSASIQVDAIVYIKIDDGDNVNADGGDGSSQIDVDGQTYIVMQADVQDNGLLRLDCERKR